MKTATTPIIVALDYSDANNAWLLVNQLSPELCRLKVGKELFVTAGPDFVRQLVDKGFDVFLDLKFYDIPNTVAQACVAAAKLGVWMLTVHASGGLRMMQAARVALNTLEGNKPLLVGVTVLTSMLSDDLQECGVDVAPEQQVLRLAELAHQANLDGVVCSANEAAVLRTKFNSDFLLVTPGIRSADHTSTDDQRRILTPKAALAAGSNYLVIGRPITQAVNPYQALENILSSL